MMVVVLEIVVPAAVAQGTAEMTVVKVAEGRSGAAAAQDRLASWPKTRLFLTRLNFHLFFPSSIFFSPFRWSAHRGWTWKQYEIDAFIP